MTDFVSGCAVIEAAQRKRVKYDLKCAVIRYGFLPFSISSLGELEEGAVTLLNRIQKFSMTQDVGARVVVHIFNRIDSEEEGEATRLPIPNGKREVDKEVKETNKEKGSTRDTVLERKFMIFV
nr:hypothetical protein [Tanacetum cinerariifolium]